MAVFRTNAAAAFPSDLKLREAFIGHLVQRWKDFQQRLKTAGTEITVKWCEGNSSPSITFISLFNFIL